MRLAAPVFGRSSERALQLKQVSTVYFVVFIKMVPFFVVTLCTVLLTAVDRRAAAGEKYFGCFAAALSIWNTVGLVVLERNP